MTYYFSLYNKINNNNKVMRLLSMKISDMFDTNPMYTSDKIVIKHISVKVTYFKVDLEPKGQGHSKKKNMPGNKNI